MKRLMAVLVLSMAGCSGVGFDTTVGGDGEIPGALAMGSVFSNFNASASLTESFNSNGTAANHISSAKVTGGSLAVTDTSSPQNTLVYISSFSITVSAPGLMPATVASVPASAFAAKPTSVQLVPNDIDLKPYIATGSLTMTPEVTFGSHPASPVPIHLAVDLHLVAGL